MVKRPLFRELYPIRPLQSFSTSCAKLSLPPPAATFNKNVHLLTQPFRNPSFVIFFFFDITGCTNNLAFSNQTYFLYGLFYTFFCPRTNRYISPLCSKDWQSSDQCLVEPVIKTFLSLKPKSIFILSNNYLKVCS